MSADASGNSRVTLRLAAVALCLFGFAGCVTAPNRPTRPADSSYGCMQAVVRDKLPPSLPDERAHCLGAGLIARYCSGSEAYLAGAGKELRDLLGHGDAQWADWRADRAGIDCARRANGDAELETCCAERGY